jgi:hypothetical protein
MDFVPAIVKRARTWPGVLRGARLAALLLALAGVGCQSPPPPVTSVLPTPEALASAVLNALAARDETALRDLALTEAEFRSRIWPDLPASRPERNLTADYVWGELAQKSGLELRGTLQRFGGQRFTLRGVEFTGETTEYQTFAVSRKSELVVTDATGMEQRIRVFGSVLRVDGGVKVFSYVVD